MSSAWEGGTAWGLPGGGGGGSAPSSPTYLVSRITRSTDQTGVASGSYQLVQFNVDSTDTAGAADGANNRLTIPADLNGLYGQITLRLVLLGTPAFGAGEQVGAKIVRKNSGGTTQETWEVRTGNSTASAIWAFTTNAHALTTGDYYQAEVLYSVNVGGRTVYASGGADAPIDLTLVVQE